MDLALGIAIPFIGTSVGALMVFFMKNQVNPKVEKILLGFASGVMIAASVWSLIIPSIEMAEEQGVISWIPATVGFILGILFLMIIDAIVPHLEPEGMAVGVVFASSLTAGSGITMAAAFALAIGIAVQNFPEGAIISMPLKSNGMPKPKAFLCGVLSGIVEPIAAIITILLTSLIVPVLPYLLAFAAGAMIYVVVDELIPESQNVGDLSKYGMIGVTLGFLVMMILDVSLG